MWDLFFTVRLHTSAPLLRSTRQIPWRPYRTCQRSTRWSTTRLPPSSPSSSPTWESSPHRLSAMNSSSYIYNCLMIPNKVHYQKVNLWCRCSLNVSMDWSDYSFLVMRPRPLSLRAMLPPSFVLLWVCLLSVSQSPPHWFAPSLVSWGGECRVKALSCLRCPHPNPAVAQKIKRRAFNKLTPAMCLVFITQFSGNTSSCFLFAALFFLRSFLVFCLDQALFFSKLLFGKGVLSFSFDSASIFCLCFSLFLSL